jgi:hypothetical protein
MRALVSMAALATNLELDLPGSISCSTAGRGAGRLQSCRLKALRSCGDGSRTVGE